MTISKLTLCMTLPKMSIVSVLSQCYLGYFMVYYYIVRIVLCYMQLDCFKLGVNCMIENKDKMTLDQEQLQQKLRDLVIAYLEKAEVPFGSLLVLGCSTSEICGGQIGKAFNAQVGEMVIDTILPLLQAKGLFLAVQCCEHLNRALVVEKSVALQNNWEIVAAVPMPQAGGSTAAAAFRKFKEPVLVEHIVAFGGIDIGDTFIGMHIKSVAVPIRLEEDTLGGAHVTFVKSRPKYIGGERACYRL